MQVGVVGDTSPGSDSAAVAAVTPALSKAERTSQKIVAAYAGLLLGCLCREDTGNQALLAQRATAATLASIVRLLQEFVLYVATASLPNLPSPRRIHLLPRLSPPSLPLPVAASTDVNAAAAHPPSA